MSIKNRRNEELEKLEAIRPPARDLSESEKAQYEKCKICVHSYWWNHSGMDTEDDLRCMFLRESRVLVALKPGIECELFEENLGCMHCVHRKSEPKTVINGEKIVICERGRDTAEGYKVRLGWESLDEGKKCISFCKKEGEE